LFLPLTALCIFEFSAIRADGVKGRRSKKIAQYCLRYTKNDRFHVEEKRNTLLLKDSDRFHSQIRPFDFDSQNTGLCLKQVRDETITVVREIMQPIPENVKEVLSSLSSAQQLTLRQYIASLRADIQSKDEEILKLRDGADDTAHYHGGVRCSGRLAVKQ
jgi:hypothetical protein